MTHELLPGLAAGAFWRLPYVYVMELLGAKAWNAAAAAGLNPTPQSTADDRPRVEFVSENGVKHSPGMAAALMRQRMLRK